MSEFKLGSLFDGSGGFPLSASLCGIEPVWASEVEPYPIAVTRSRFPNMVHLGDVSKINGAEIEPVDIVSFGSPCQGLSVAGLRKGLADNRSGLFLQSIRIIKEMRKATNGRCPTFVFFENVPGIFSSNKGEDFRTALEELIKTAEPSAVMSSVPKGGWAYADYYCGDRWSLAYRTLDSQHIRTAQRRRRVFLVLDLGGQRARKILFESDRLRGHPPQSGTPWQTTPADAQGSIGADDLAREWRMLGGLKNNNERPVMTAYSMQAFGKYRESEKASALKARDYKDATDLVLIEERPIVIDRAFYNQGQNALYDPQIYEDGTVPTIVARGPAAVCHKKKDRYIVRRLTPTECARLQGFPDKWGHPDRKDELTDEEYRFWHDVRNTHEEINGKAVKEYTKQQMLTWYNKLHTDSSEYKMWGNGIALPCALYVMQGIEDALKGR